MTCRWSAEPGAVKTVNETVAPIEPVGRSIPGLLDSLTTLSQTMLTAADRQDWEHVAALESNRHRLLIELFANPHIGDSTDAVIFCVHQILQVNEGLVARGEAALHDLTVKLGELDLGQQAVRAYGNAS